MKKFTYKLQNLLDIKVKLEDQAKTTYGNAVKALEDEKEKLRIIEEKKHSYEEKQRSLMQGRLDLTELKLVQEGIKLCEDEMKARKVQIRNAAHRVEIARIRLANAMVERKTQEKLKEKLFEEYKKEYNMEEQKEIDERNSFEFRTDTSAGKEEM